MLTIILGTLLWAQAAVPAPAAGPPSCLAAAGAVDGRGSSLPAAVAGTSFKKAKAIRKLRRKTKGGALIVIEGGDFTGWDFRKADLSGVCFKGSKLAGSDWTGVTAPGMGFIDSDLSGAKFVGAKMLGVLFRTATLASADASKADFAGGQLDGGWSASLAGWKLDGANMAGFRFRCGVTEVDGCPFDRQGISAKSADFTNAVFEGFAFWDAQLEGAKFDDAEMGINGLAQLQHAAVPASIEVRTGAARIELPGTTAVQIGQSLATSASAPRRTASRAGSGKWLFLSKELAAVPIAANDPAGAATLRLLVQAAPSYLLVSAGKNGRALVRGRARSPKGDRCWIDAGPLWRGKGGSYLIASPSRRRAATPAVTVVGDEAMVAPEQDAAVDSMRIVNCAGVNSFTPMKRVPVDELTFEALWSAAAKPAS